MVREMFGEEVKSKTYCRECAYFTLTQYRAWRNCNHQISGMEHISNPYKTTCDFFEPSLFDLVDPEVETIQSSMIIFE